MHEILRISGPCLPSPTFNILTSSASASNLRFYLICIHFSFFKNLSWEQNRAMSKMLVMTGLKTLTSAHFFLVSPVSAPNPIPGGSLSHCSFIWVSWCWISGGLRGSSWSSTMSTLNIRPLYNTTAWTGVWPSDSKNNST